MTLPLKGGLLGLLGVLGLFWVFGDFWVFRDFWDFFWGLWGFFLLGFSFCPPFRGLGFLFEPFLGGGCFVFTALVLFSVREGPRWVLIF
jgi:hypothetical protein